MANKRAIKKAAVASTSKATKKRRGNKTRGSVVTETKAAKTDCEVMDLYLQGFTAPVIAERLGRSARTVRGAIARARKRWREEVPAAYNAAVNEFNDRSGMLLAKVLDAYARSCTEPMVKIVTGPDGVVTKTTEKLPSGDPRLLALAQRISEAMAKSAGVIDGRYDARDSIATVQASPLIEVVVKNRGEVERLQSMQFAELEESLVVDVVAAS